MDSIIKYFKIKWLLNQLHYMITEPIALYDFKRVRGINRLTVKKICFLKLWCNFLAMDSNLLVSGTHSTLTSLQKLYTTWYFSTK